MTALPLLALAWFALPWLSPQAGPPRLPDARAQLDYARGVARATHGLEGAALESARLRAVTAYRAVRVHHPTEVALAAEASFRAGEVLRAAGRADEALDEFRTVRRFASESTFRGRALLEIGHVHRRAAAQEEALDAYVALALEENARRVDRDRAVLWAGRVHATAGRTRAARRMWSAAAEGAVDPVLRIAAHDELIAAWLRVDDLEAAAGQWEQCRAALDGVAGEATQEGLRVRRAMERMDSVEQLVARIHARAERGELRGDP